MWWLKFELWHLVGGATPPELGNSRGGAGFGDRHFSSGELLSICTVGRADYMTTKFSAS